MKHCHSDTFYVTVKSLLNHSDELWDDKSPHSRLDCDHLWDTDIAIYGYLSLSLKMSVSKNWIHISPKITEVPEYGMRMIKMNHSLNGRIRSNK